MPEEIQKKTKKKRVRTAPFPLPPEKVEQVRAARESRSEELPTTFIEDERYFVLQIGRQATLGYSGLPEASWEWHDSTWTVAACLSTVEKLSPGQFTVTAEYKGEQIGRGRYLKREDLSIEIIETSGAMVGLLEPAIEKSQQERLREEEARRTVPCDYPGCDEQVLASTGIARLVQVQVDGQTYTLAFYSCEGMHREALRLASSLSIALLLQTSTASSNRSSSVRLIELSLQHEDDMTRGERNSQG